ncbi:RNA ligase family protein [Streptomyces sp. SP17KL33]|uniref:RNA ligase family protein n=1 Tax=Streptomyces sp. SP17KL33 TaxID=3002534 RepID=UPI002E7736F2|nr:RNA ligase family protein [Streptomyces sp. SP17KL33]MEE1835773.1 RNA ligase family protein [Streptomyces sp. SP17KL33]
MTEVEFAAWPKTPRLFRDIIITEKIDGTNAALHIDAEGNVTAQSRKRLIYPHDDNFGFANWAAENAAILAPLLGPGVHFGEWWGRGIQRNYGLTERRFSLFNVHRHADIDAEVGGARVNTVPVLYQGPFREEEITHWLSSLAMFGSVAVPGFADPEGICVFHTASRNVYKVTLDNNDAGKWEH